MGADARLYIFDYSVYRDSVVPAFLRLLRDGSREEWLREIYRADRERWIDRTDGYDFNRFGGVDLLTHCTYLDSEFALRSRMPPASLYDYGWESRTCKSSPCPVRDRCPLLAREDKHAGDPEELLRLFWLVVAHQGLGT